MDTKVKGIILKLIDYKDADKLAHIFSLEEGIVTAKFSGVKKEKAKLKAVAQPFVFAEFTLNEKADKMVVTSAEIIDSFPNILLDYSRTMCGYVVLDIARRIIPANKQEPELFYATLNALKQMETVPPHVALISYILNFVSLSGEGLEFPNVPYVFLDLDIGNFSLTRTTNSLAIDKKVFSTLKAINSLNFNNPTNENEFHQQIVGLNLNEPTQTTKQILKLLHNILYIKYNVDISSFEFI